MNSAKKQRDIGGYDCFPLLQSSQQVGIYKNTKAHYIQDIIPFFRIYSLVLYGRGTDAYSGLK